MRAMAAIENKRRFVCNPLFMRLASVLPESVCVIGKPP